MVWPRLENGPVSGRTEARVGLIRASDDKNVCELVPGGRVATARSQGFDSPAPRSPGASYWRASLCQSCPCGASVQVLTHGNRFCGRAMCEPLTNSGPSAAFSDDMVIKMGRRINSVPGYQHFHGDRNCGSNCQDQDLPFCGKEAVRGAIENIIRRIRCSIKLGRYITSTHASQIGQI